MGARSFCEYERPNRTRVPVHARIDRGWATDVCVEIRDGHAALRRGARQRGTNERWTRARARALGHRARRVTRARAAGFARPHASTTRSPSSPRARARDVRLPTEARPSRAIPRSSSAAALAREMASLRESRGALRLGDAPDAPALGFEATAPIQLPDASRARPASASDGDAVSVPADVPSKLRGWALALALGRALPPAPPPRPPTAPPPPSRGIPTRLVSPPSIAQVASSSTPTPPPRARALRRPRSATPSTPARDAAWRPNAGATLAVGGANGVCVWSHEAGARDGVGGVGGAPFPRGRAHGRRAPTAPQAAALRGWRRSLCDADPSAAARAPTASPRASSRSSAGWRRTSPPHSRDSFPFCPTFRPTFRPTIRVPVVVVPRRRPRSLWRFRRLSSPRRRRARPRGDALLGPLHRSARQHRVRRVRHVVPRVVAVRGLSTPAHDGRWELRCGRRTRDERVVVHGRRARDGGGVGPAKRRRCGGVGHHARRRAGQVLAVHLPDGAPSLAARILPVELPRRPRAGRRRRRIRRRARRGRADIAGMCVGSLGGNAWRWCSIPVGPNGARERGTRRVIFGSNLALVSASHVGHRLRPGEGRRRRRGGRTRARRDALGTGRGHRGGVPTT